MTPYSPGFRTIPTLHKMSQGYVGISPDSSAGLYTIAGDKLVNACQSLLCQI